MTNKALKGAVGAYDLSFCEQDCSYKLVQIQTVLQIMVFCCP